MTGDQIFKSLWEITHFGGWENIPIKKQTLKDMLDWMAQNMKKSLLTKLGLRDISTLTDRELESRIAEDQTKRTKIRKANQVKYGKKKGKKA